METVQKVIVYDFYGGSHQIESINHLLQKGCKVVNASSSSHDTCDKVLLVVEGPRKVLYP
jgi:hypothetical protein